MKKLRIVCANIKSASAALLANALSQQLGYKVLRSTQPKDIRENIVYGDQKDKLTQYNYFFDNVLNFPGFT